MREIKFRAWHNGKMLHQESFMSTHVFSITSDGKVFYKDEPGYVNGKNRDSIVMQYTGLKDKNGKEIYEGDLVVHDGEECEVNFKGGSFGIDFQETPNKPYDRILSSTKWEVIGNIYEKIEQQK